MPISPESDYCLHGSVSLLGMTVDIEAGARRSFLDVDGIVDRSPGYRPGQPDFFSAEVTREVLAWRGTRASAMDRAHMGWAGLLASEQQFEEAIGGAANQLLDLHLDAIGAPQDRIFARSIPEELADLRITDPDALVRADNVERVLRHGYLGRWMGALAAQHGRVVEGIGGVSPLAYAAELRHEYDVVRPREHARLLESMGRPASVHGGSRIDRRRVRHGRKAARKGMKLYGNLFGQEGIKTFVRGDTLRIEGTLYDYHVTKTVGIVKHSANPTSGHIPYQLDIHDKSGQFLAGGCVYFQDTPVIDQIIGLSLHVRDREDEVSFLRSTNMLNRSLAYYDDPMLPAIKNDTRPSDAPEGLDGLFAGEEGLFAPRNDAHEALRLAARRAVTELLPDLLDVPRHVVRVMQAPPFRADELSRMPLPVLGVGLEGALRAIGA